MPIDWKSPEAYQRLLAAIMAAQDGMKLDYRRIASMYGQGATYDSIEGRFRIIKREATTLRAEIDSGARAPAPARGTSFSTTTTTNSNSFASTATSSQQSTTPKKAKTPTTKKKEGGVLGGRVSKNGTPTKKGNTGRGGIKAEGAPDENVVGNEGMMVKDEDVEIMEGGWAAALDADGGMVGWDFHGALEA